MAIPGVISRRSILMGIAAMGTSLLAACSSSAPASPSAAPASAASPSAPAPASTAASRSTPTPAAQAAPSGTPSPGASPAALAGSATNQLPRAQTLILSESDATNQFADVQNMNPYLAGIARSGWQFAFEPLYFYNTYYTDQVCGPPGMPCKDGEIPWQAESYAYSSDYTELTIKLRNGITWSDGQPFTASDVAFTLNMLKDNAPKLVWSPDVHQWVKDAVALDPLTAKITLNAPNPRFMFDYFMMHYDQGLVMVPEHIFKGQDPTTFTNFDMGKKWPIVTGPWQLVLSSPEQKFWDRRDDWWAAKAGFHPLPAMKRIIDLPSYEDTKRLELLLSNQVDATHNMQPANAITAIQQNPKLKMWLPSSPYGLIDFTTNGMFFNCAKSPFNDPDIRWAINHALNRDQVVQVGYHGNGVKATLPLPGFPSMKPYYDAASDVLQRQPIDAYDLNKTAQIMQAKGYAKDQGGFWAKGGKRFPLVILIPPGFFGDITPVIVEQLRKAGFDASFKAISTYSTIEALGQEDAFLTTFGGSVRDPYFNLDYFVSQYSAPTNQPAVQPYRWENAQFDQAVARMGTVPATDPAFMSAYHQAIDLWVTALPGIPIVQNFVMIPVNTTYWTNWPDAANPYTIPSNWHRTAGRRARGRTDVGRLQDRVAIITGGVSGIGKATAELFAREGARVVVGDLNDERGAETVDVIRRAGGEGLYVHADVSVAADARDAVARTLDRFGRVDVLVNNAGLSIGDSVLDTDEAAWDRNFAVVLKGAYHFTRATLPAMRERRRGSIVNIASVNGLLGLGEDAYSAAKAGLINFTQNLAVRYGAEGIRANVICPGTVRTPIWRETLAKRPDVFERLAAWYPLGRVGEPEDIARAALFLASDDAAWITGAVLPVDGGLTAGMRRMAIELQGE